MNTDPTGFAVIYQTSTSLTDLVTAVAWANYSPTALKKKKNCVHRFHLFTPKISPKWLIEMRRLWTSIPWWVACKFTSLIDFHTVPGHNKISPLRLRRVKGVWVLKISPPPALLEKKWPGSFTCYCGNTGVELIPIWESARVVYSGEENSPTAPAGYRTRDLPITSPAPYHWATPRPLYLSGKSVAYPVSFNESHVDVEVARSEHGHHEGGDHGEETAHGQEHGAHPQEERHSTRLFTRHQRHHEAG